ncbi:hypothetical protein AB0E83_28745 [Streptomyces sp. NPDC035033]|uniref:hypothetical protein n=1 Tax=Streptomyces sp. NPDC035033 TaxID=3155368 RepID=UPI0033CF3BA3
MKHAKARTVAALALVLLASGCSQPKEEKRAFEVPDSLCGTPVPAELLSPVLPASGTKIEEERKPGKGYFSCRVVVDGTTVLTADWNWTEKGRTPRSVAYDNPYLDIAEHEGGGGKYVYSSTGGVSRVTCDPVVAHRKGKYELFARVFVSDGEKSAPAMEKLITTYAEALSASSECEQK